MLLTSIAAASQSYRRRPAVVSGGGGGGSDVLSNPVTTALTATGSGTTYTANNDSELRAIPWGSLTPGSVVNITYNGGTPYNTKIGTRAQGTSTNPIIIHGVTDASGNRPKINGNGATVASGSNPGGYGAASATFSATADYGQGLGVVVVKRGPNDPYATYAPKWLQIQNLEVYGGYVSNAYTSYTPLAGSLNTGGGSISTASHSAGGAGIYLLLAEDCIIENCIVYQNSFGVFMQAKDNLFSEACKRITVRNCRVYSNGVNGSFFEHNFYVQCANPIIEGNYIGQVIAGSQGSSYKSRSSGEIFRYNYVEASARACDWVQSEDQSTDGIVTQSDYGVDYVYGNVFVNDQNLPRGGAYGALHFGGDNLGEEDQANVSGGNYSYPSYRDTLYFFSNTYVQRATSAQSYRTAIFALSLVPTTINCWNNLIVLDGTSLFQWMAFSGNVNLHGVNLTYPAPDGDAHDAATNAAKYEFTNNGTLLTTDPLLTDIVTARDYTISSGSSPAVGAATSPAAMSAVIAAHPVLYSPRLATNGLIARAAVTELGAYEYP